MNRRMIEKCLEVMDRSLKGTEEALQIMKETAKNAGVLAEMLAEDDQGRDRQMPDEHMPSIFDLMGSIINEEENEKCEHKNDEFYSETIEEAAACAVRQMEADPEAVIVVKGPFDGSQIEEIIDMAKEMKKNNTNSEEKEDDDEFNLDDINE